MPEIVFAAETVAVRWHDTRVQLERDQAWHAGDPFVTSNPDLFRAAPSRVRGEAPTVRVVETATRAPGERRRTRRAE